uniref:Cytochrome c oxidase subunit 2 n=2 Tax=Lasioderma serricorne TaxID=295660 RepID=A0A4P8D2J3_9COLE|nr:cytochrome c oxidase subunit II [Lasioderma serricorne]QYH50916.1 cytochrome c oxidase subunit 2 [Lasioderma serricorne]
MATWQMLSSQDGMSPLMEQLLFFHDHTMMILILITMMVGYLMISLFFNKFNYRFLLEGQLIELIWTILPAIILLFIALPSLRILYMLDEVNNASLTIKTIGHQWYWSYEYSDFKNIEFDSYMIPINEMLDSNFRLLDVDNRLVLPMNSKIRLMVTATDVIHSWALSSLGVKIDATPGRLNQTSFFINYPGLLYGQCSEICGSNHSFMPIVIESVSIKNFLKWI